MKRLLKDYRKLHIDVETYSSVDLLKSGHYKYSESPDFEILMVAFAFDDKEIEIVDLAAGEKLPEIFLRALQTPTIKKCAHNAAFERNCFKRYGYDVPIDQWECTMIKAAYCGLPFSLDDVCKIMKFDESKTKDPAGKALMKFFCMPCKPTKVNGQRERNFWHHDLTKWTAFKNYCLRDVAAEREIDTQLKDYSFPAFEAENYILDQEINDRGVLIDLDFAKAAIQVYEKTFNGLKEQMLALTGLENSNSSAQLKKWLSEALNQQINSVKKADIDDLILQVAAGPVREALLLRQRMAKTSIKKYNAMLNSACSDNRARGLFQFYGANRTGRWAGRLIQLQNLPRNYLKLLSLARKTLKEKDDVLLALLFGDVQNILSQLIRTSFVAPEGKILCVSDFSAIEARVTAWFADEQWRLGVFNTHGKIYEASASMMFKVPLESIGKKSDERQKGKVAELSLGYGGSLGALKKMGGEAMGLSEPEMKALVRAWRAANPAICALWKNLENCALKAYLGRRPVLSNKGLIFDCDGKVLTIELPSGRKLFYQEPFLKINKWGKKAIAYKGLNQETKHWGTIDTYGGKLAENIVQAFSRDLLVQAMQKLKAKDFVINMHVHDEVVVEVDEVGASFRLDEINRLMGEPVPWALDLPLGAEGYLTPFYKKD